jgi:hypothetical protein
MLTLLSILLAPTAAPPLGPPSFAREVAPLLRAHCLKCHAGPKARADLDLTSRAGLLAGGTHGPALVPGKAASSPLFVHVRDGKMPPRAPLPARDAETLRRWIDAGAAWEGPALRPVAVASEHRAGPDWWALQPIRRPRVPVVRGAAQTPVDAFLLAALEKRGLGFSPEADRLTLLRRVSFDLTGLAPTPEEIDAFLADERPDAYERLVDRLLASPAYGERYARHWLDVVRFAESHGYEMNQLRRSAWPYRDWVIRAHNDDLPYRDFVRQQLAGDVGPNDMLAQSATGFLVAGPHDMVGNSTVEGTRQQRADDLADIVATTSGAFLGLTVGCARCHDHKFDPISQKDFYAIQALVSGVTHADRPIAGVSNRDRLVASLRDRLERIDKALDDLEPIIDGKTPRPAVQPGRNVERFAPRDARFVRFRISATNDGSEPCIDELELYGPDSPANLALASRGVKNTASSTYPGSDIHRLEHLNDGRVGNGRSWISAEKGKGWVRLELPRVEKIARVVWGRDREGRYRDRLARTYAIEVSTDGKAWAAVAGSGDRTGADDPRRQKLLAERAATEAELTRARSPMVAYAGTFTTPDVVHRLKRGDVMQPLEIVPPAALSAVKPALSLTATDEPSRRFALADWIAHADNPLAARVHVNRLWQRHFGQGIIRTPSDFGFNGDRPSHPELLDWLASEFRDGGGTTKRIHRLILLSNAYRQSSRLDPKAAELDAGNRLVWRNLPRRLEAEAIRDAMLSVSGELDRRMGGPGYDLWEYSNYVMVFKPRTPLGPDTFRRMVYQFKPRLQQDGTFGAFDCPDATTTLPRRNTSTTALQALNLLNDPFVLDQAERFAGRLQREAGDDPREQTRGAFRLAFGRYPGDAEQAAAVRLIERHGLVRLCRALFNANEFVHVP